MKRQIGLERTPELFVEQMVEVFRLVREVLADDGTCWINLGDSYASDMKGSGGATAKQLTNAGSFHGGAQRLHHGLKPKDLCGIPWRVAFALQADGWYLRSDIIWHKPNPMPESVTDRPTRAHEYVFLLSKSGKYFCDMEAIKEPSVRAGAIPMGGRAAANRIDPRVSFYRPENGVKPVADTRNRRTVWTIATSPFPGAHFATFPPKLVEPCILAGTSEKGHCPECGARWVRVVERSSAEPARTGAWKATGANHRRDIERKGGFYEAKSETLGFRPTCTHNLKPVPDVCLDPFAGSGTTGMVAEQLGREFVGVELNPRYSKLARESREARKAA